MIHVMLVVLLNFIRLSIPAPDCMFLDRGGFTVPAYPQQITDATGTYHILSVPATARLLQCDGFKPITFRSGMTTYAMQTLKTGQGIIPPVSPTTIGE